MIRAARLDLPIADGSHPSQVAEAIVRASA